MTIVKLGLRFWLFWMVFMCVARANGQELPIAGGKNAWPILVPKGTESTIRLAVSHFADDIEMLTGVKPAMVENLDNNTKNLVIAGTPENSIIIKQLIKSGKLKPSDATRQWEGLSIQMIKNPMKGVDNALVITGNHYRAVAFGIFHLSQLFGVSPWYWWADVPIVKKDHIYLPANYRFDDYPRVKYRGIFINDEAPALSNWSKEKLGGFNAKFYRKVFELMLRLKSNYIWPAMWGNAFYDDDSLNMQAAKEYGIVIGTSHHEPLMRAHDEWRRYGKGKWNYDSNEAKLKEFWKKGMERATNEKIVTVGMRGDGDEPMSRETATSLLERIVTDQRKIITEVTGKPAEQTPQLWALYKEVQDYYDKGMRVPDDVTLLLCDDNWGNIRRLPALNEKPRKGGYGIYYHFDYVGGPRNYKWINTNHISRIYEQMHLAWEYKAKEIWIVNVGDIKPMEFPISFFLDYAWNPDRIGAEDLMNYTENWVSKQFGDTHAKQIAYVLNKYTKYNSRRKPELLDANTYSVETGEWDKVKDEYLLLLNEAEAIGKALPMNIQDAYFQLVLHPVRASSNLYQMYHAVAKNNYYVQRGDTAANRYAREVRQFYQKDSAITVAYHQLNNGKWNHMMSQTHIGYTYWQQPNANRMPATINVPFYNQSEPVLNIKQALPSAYDKIPAGTKGNIFYEQAGMASMYADHYTRMQEVGHIKWKVLPDHGRTGNAITTWPVTHAPLQNETASFWLEYDVYSLSKDTLQLHFYFSPTLNFQHLTEGLQFEVKVNDGPAKVLSINKNDYDTRAWERWVASNVIKVISNHGLSANGKQTIRYRPLHPGIILQKIVADFGGLEQSYLGPLETIYKN